VYSNRCKDICNLYGFSKYLGERMAAIDVDIQAEEQVLENFLSEGVEGASARAKLAFDDFAQEFRGNIVLFGAGNLGRRTLLKLREKGIEPLAFIDSDAMNWGTTVEGLQLLSPNEAAERYGRTAVFVVTVWGALGQDRMRTRIDQLRSIGCLRVCSFVPLYWKYSDALLPHYAVALPHLLHHEAAEVRAAFRLWNDEASRREYLAQLRWRLTADFDCLPVPVNHPIYFPADLCRLLEDEVFVDCGAFDGDTVRLFLEESQGKFKRVVAFEADPTNFRLMKKNLSHLSQEARSQIQLYPAATSNEDGRLRIASGNGPASSIGDGDCEIDAVTLDSALSGTAITYLKMDIEGSEIASLVGATQQIRDNAPVLAISVYHRQNDLWRIPLLIYSINPDYKLFLRPHRLEGWDLVCYAIPTKRLISEYS
jgi:FkbM family methyltransferase